MIIIITARKIEIPVLIVIPSPKIKYVIIGNEIIPVANPNNNSSAPKAPQPDIASVGVTKTVDV